MLLYFEHKLDQLNMKAKEAFRIAHIWKFGKDVHVTQAYIDYTRHSVLPFYVVEWLKDMQAKEQPCTPPSATVIAS